jgi:hypothetical protein
MNLGALRTAALRRPGAPGPAVPSRRLVRAGVLVAIAVIAAVAAPGGRAPASAAGPTLSLTAGSDDTGWVALTVHGPPGGSATLTEQVGGRTLPVARLALPAGTGRIAHAAPWRCRRRARRFTATTDDAGATTRTAVTTITTPSCAHRLRLIVAPAAVRPGGAANVRVSDTWRFGAVSASVCTRAGSVAQRCRRVRLGPGVRRVRVPLAREGRWTIALRTATGQLEVRHVEARSDARPRIVVTGDSMVYGIYETLGRDLGTARSVHGDPHPATGLTSPTKFDWPKHVRASAREDRADATIVFLGAADLGYPLTPPGGEPEPCCGPAWISEYARLAGGLMASYERQGRGLVYWVLLPEPRPPDRAEVFHAITAAVRRAAARFSDGVRLVSGVADVIAPHGQYHKTIVFKGRRRLVRVADGVHLATPGIHIATAILIRALRGDGLLGR